MTQTPDVITYSTVTTREIVPTALKKAALHGLYVKAVDMLSSFVMASNRENIWTVLRPEFGDNDGKSTIIVRVL